MPSGMASAQNKKKSKRMTSVGFEPTPTKTTALTLRLRPLGHDVVAMSQRPVTTCTYLLGCSVGSTLDTTEYSVSNTSYSSQLLGFSFFKIILKIYRPVRWRGPIVGYYLTSIPNSLRPQINYYSLTYLFSTRTYLLTYLLTFSWGNK